MAKKVKTTKIQIGREPERSYNDFTINREFKMRAGESTDPSATEVTGSGKALVSVNGEWKEQNGYGYRYKEHDSIEWDGNTEGLDHVTWDSEGINHFYRVSDGNLTIDDLLGATISGITRYGDVTNKSSSVIVEDMIDKSVYGGDACSIFLGDLFPYALFAPYDGATYGPEDDPQSRVFEHAGLYFCKSLYRSEELEMIQQTTSVEFADKVSKLDIDYLPDGGFGYSENFKQVDITWDGDTSEHVIVDIGDGTCLCLVSENVPTVKELIGGTIEITQGDEHSEVTLDETNTGDAGPYIIIGNYTYAIKEDNTILGEGLIVPKAGIYFYKFVDEGSVGYVSGLHYGGKEIIHKIDEKYLPASGGGALVVHMTGEYQLIEQDEQRQLVVSNGHIDHTIEEILAADAVIFVYSPIVEIGDYVVNLKYALPFVYSYEIDGLGVAITAESHYNSKVFATTLINATEDGEVSVTGGFLVNI